MFSSLLFLSLNPAMHAISLFAFVSNRIIKSIFETWVRLGLLDSTMFSLLFLSLNPAMHEILPFAFETTILFVLSIRIIKSIFETWVYLGVLYSTIILIITQ
jgi:hypothetical protein